MYYKVVRKISSCDGDESKDMRYSVVAEDREHRCEYKQGEQTVPSTGLLFVFTSYQAALDWTYKMGDSRLEIWTVSALEPRPCPFWIPSLMWSSVDEVWCGEEFADTDGDWEAPEGSVLAKAVTLLEKVDSSIPYRVHQ